LQGLLTPVIGLTTLYIAYQQHQMEKAKSRHERYERRLKFFKQLRNPQNFSYEVSHLRGYDNSIL
jgi:hypothetical protein